MGEINRRTFLLSTGRWLLLAGSAASISGCARALRWSESQGRLAGTEETASTTSLGGASSTGTPGPDGTTISTAFSPTPPDGPTPTTGSSPGTSSNDALPPDLVVIKGDYPDRNVRAAIAGLGGMERFVRRDARVVIKPNVLTGRPPEYATTTNPVVVATLIRMCLEAGAAEVTILDYPTSSPRAAFQASGLTQAIAEAGGRLKYLSGRNFERVEIPEGKLLSSWPLVSDALEADTLINVPIGKNHGMAGLTLAMKNLMGIMGDPRGRIHIDFPEKITDINTRVKPHLVVLDAYRVLTRNGPTGGNLADVQMPKTVVAGVDQLAVDAYGATIMGWKPTDLPSLVEAASRGLGEADLSKLNIVEGTA